MSKNAEGWIRHRGGKCPVEVGTLIDIRCRDGLVRKGVPCGKDFTRTASMFWSHEGDGAEVMAYRLHKPAEQVEACSKPKVYSGTLHNLEIIGQGGPLQWRDRIAEIDATTMALTTERAELVQKLASEGFALIGRINDLLTEAAQKHEDMSDPKNWRNGDIVECIVDHENYFTAGSRYVVDYMECDWVNIHSDDKGDENAIRPHKVKFHSRPSA